MNPETDRELKRKDVIQKKEHRTKRDAISATKFDFIGDDKSQIFLMRKNYSQEMCITLGFALLMIGLLGFVMPNLFAMHLGYILNVIHFVSGFTALVLGFKSVSAAKVFCALGGISYLSVGVSGFYFGSQGFATVGGVGEDQYLWRVIPEIIELASADHYFNSAIGVGFLFGLLFIMNVKTSKSHEFSL